MKASSGHSTKYFGTIYGLETINRFKVDLFILDEKGGFQPILNLVLAPCSFSSFCEVLEKFHTLNAETKISNPQGFVSLQLLGESGLAVVSFASAMESSLAVNFSGVNHEIAKLILNLSKNIVDQAPEFKSDCP